MIAVWYKHQNLSIFPTNEETCGFTRTDKVRLFLKEYLHTFYTRLRQKNNIKRVRSQQVAGQWAVVVNAFTPGWF